MRQHPVRRGHRLREFLGHFAENDPHEPREGMQELEAALKDVGRAATFYIYEGTTHWFFEPDRPDPERVLHALIGSCDAAVK